MLVCCVNVMVVVVNLVGQKVNVSTSKIAPADLVAHCH